MGHRLPNFLLVGAMKAGTTAVHEHLAGHPEVYCSPIKEPNFFSDDIDVRQFSPEVKTGIDADEYVQGDMAVPVHHAYVRRPATYAALFRKVADETAIGECSTSYLYSTVAARNIREALPDARILMILRNPVERAISHYIMDCRIGTVRQPFGRALEEDLASSRKGWGVSRLYVELGQYTGQIERYLRHFPADRIKIVIFDDLKRDFRGVTDDIAAFLGIDPERMPDGGAPVNRARVARLAGLNAVLNRAGAKELIVRHAPERLLELGKRLYYRDADGRGVTEDDRERLRGIFADEVEALSGLLGRDFSGWLRGVPVERGAASPQPGPDLDRLAVATRPEA